MLASRGIQEFCWKIKNKSNYKKTIEEVFNWIYSYKDTLKNLPEEQRHKLLLKGTFEGLCLVFGASN